MLKGGNAAWKAAGLPVEKGEIRLLLRIDRYRQPDAAADKPAKKKTKKSAEAD